jgi:hypothetical protein
MKVRWSIQKRRYLREAGSELPKSRDTTEMANAKFEASKYFGESAPSASAFGASAVQEGIGRGNAGLLPHCEISNFVKA